MDDNRKDENQLILQVENLSVNFNTYAGVVKAVRGVSFGLRQGEVLAIVGESGCGKTVTSKAVLRLFKPPLVSIGEESRVLYGGKDVMKMNRRQLQAFRGGQVSMIFQDPMTSLNPTMRVGKQIAEALLTHNKGMSKQEAWNRSVDMLRTVGIPNPEQRARSYPHQLSGGMRQRVVIAIALSCGPNIIMADEPTTALDVTIQAQILDLLAEIRENTGTAVILVTHDLGVVANFADRIAVMYAGQIVETGPKRELFYSPSHPYTRALLDSVPKQDDKSAGELFSLKGTPPDLILDMPYCPFSARCAYCMPICTELPPPETPVAQGGENDAQGLDEHRVRCWLQHTMAPAAGALNEGRAGV